ncbi:hypothetical protein GCM10009628_29190 [Paeniglutamicibacter kerguelensis]
MFKNAAPANPGVVSSCLRLLHGRSATCLRRRSPAASGQPRSAEMAVKKKVPSTGEMWDNSHYIPHHRSTASEWLPSSRPAVPPHIKIADNRDFHANNGGQFGCYQLLPDI